MTEESLPAEIIKPMVAPTGSVIWMHGLGADGHDFDPIAQQYSPLLDQGVRFIFPHGPTRAVTVNQGMRMPAWFDVYDLDFLSKEDEVGIVASEKQIQHLIEQEKAEGVPTDRIVLGGFSQGGAMDLQVGLRFKERLGGLIVLSAYLPLAQSLAEQRSSHNQNIPIFMAHGLFDPVVPLMLGERSKEKLQLLGYTLEWKTYPTQHTVVSEEIQAVGEFLTRILL